MATKTHSDDYPTITAWSGTAGESHPWRRLLLTPIDPEVSRPTVADMSLRPLEVMALIVQNSRPAGLGSFLDRFPDSDLKNLLAVRFELLVAFNLAVQGLSYAFGGLGEPDFVWRQGQTDEAWLEVTRVSLDDFDRFRESLEDEAARRDVSLLFEVAAWPLTIRRQNHVFAEISRLIDATAIDGRERRIALPELGDGASVSCRPGPPDGLSRTPVHHAGFDTTSQYRDSLADKLSRSIEIKDSQARRGEWQQATGLLIDISTARYGQLLSQEELASMLSASIDWRASPYAAVSICYSNLHGVGMWGVCKFRPDVDRAIRDALEPALLTMGLPAL